MFFGLPVSEVTIPKDRCKQTMGLDSDLRPVTSQMGLQGPPVRGAHTDI